MKFAPAVACSLFVAWFVPQKVLAGEGGAPMQATCHTALDGSTICVAISGYLTTGGVAAPDGAGFVVPMRNYPQMAPTLGATRLYVETGADR